jgi:transglutaminase-like putative cysteine protease
MQLQVIHRTAYTFSRPLTNLVQLLRLEPLSCLNQTVLDWRIDVDCDARLRETRDGYGNCVHMLYVDSGVTELAVTATGRVITEDRKGVVQGVPGELPAEIFLRPTALTTADDGVLSFANALRSAGDDPLTLLHKLNSALHERMIFDGTATSVTTSAAEAFAAGRGVCQDFAHIFISVARLCDTPARFVSGHLFRRDGQDAQTAGHGWAEAWVPALGWVAFDPAHGICADDAYVRIAAGLDYRDAAPTVGTRRGGGSETMSVEVSVAEAAPRRSMQRQSQSQSQSKG